jgi:ethanolamine ammonia-lyase small subunit
VESYAVRGKSYSHVIRGERSDYAGLRDLLAQANEPILVRFCRVGVIYDIGDLLDPAFVDPLIAVRYGLATAESLSAYFACRPRAGQTAADRNRISNIRAVELAFPRR